MITKFLFFFLFAFLVPFKSHAQDTSGKGIPIERIQQVLADPDYTMSKRLTINIKKRLRKNPEFINFYIQNNYFIFKTAFIRAVAELADKKFCNYLIPYLNDENEQVAASAINALGYTNDPIYIEHLAPLLEKYKDNELMTVRLLAALGNSFSDNAITHISPMTNDHRINIAYSAVLSLSQIGSEKAVSILIKEYKQPILRQKIISSLGKCRNSNTAIDFIAHIARNPDHPYFLDAVKSIGELESEENLAYLIGLLDENNKKLTITALYAISRICDIHSIKDIYAFLDNIKSRSVKEKAYSAIETICACYSKEEILKSIEGTGHPALIAVELGKLGDPSSKNVLLELLEDDDPVNKIFAVDSLSPLNDESIIDNLISRLSSSNPLETYCVLNYLKNCYENNLVSKEYLIEKISNFSYRNDKLDIFYALIDFYNMEENIISVLSDESNPYLWIMINSVKNWGNYPSIIHLLKYYLRKGSLPVRYHSAKTLLNFSEDNPELKPFLEESLIRENNKKIKETLLNTE